jgi:hypothetical protein
MQMWRRSNALSNAWGLMCTKDNEERTGYADELAILQTIRDEASEVVRRDKEEAGFEG